MKTNNNENNTAMSVKPLHRGRGWGGSPTAMTESPLPMGEGGGRGRFFSLKELTHSLTAQAHSIPNVPTAEAEKNLVRLATEVLDPLREAWQSPIYITSGYRSPELNRKVGGTKTSYHLRGMAADITAKSVFYNTALYTELRILHAGGLIPLTECYLERQGLYIHVAFDPNNINPQPFFTK